MIAGVLALVLWGVGTLMGAVFGINSTEDARERAIGVWTGKEYIDGMMIDQRLVFLEDGTYVRYYARSSMENWGSPSESGSWKPGYNEEKDSYYIYLDADDDLWWRYYFDGNDLQTWRRSARLGAFVEGITMEKGEEDPFD